jgi:hypothetical protein
MAGQDLGCLLDQLEQMSELIGMVSELTSTRWLTPVGCPVAVPNPAPVVIRTPLFRFFMPRLPD